MSDATPPAWLTGLAQACHATPPDWFRAFPIPAQPRRLSAILMLFGPHTPRVTPPAPDDDAKGSATRAGRPGHPDPVALPASGVDVVLTERAHTLRSHAAQVSFPGGHIDPDDVDPVDAALREAHEEVGLRRDSVDVLGTLPRLFLPPSGNTVTPVVAWWREPHPIGVVDPGEVARVVRAPLDDLRDPANRFMVRTPQGFVSPGFGVDGLFVWGFTGKLVESVLDLAGLHRDWDTSRSRPLPRSVVAAFRPNTD